MLSKIFKSIFLIIILFSCSKKEAEVYKTTEKLNPYSLYAQGLKAFDKNDFFANKKFSEAELRFNNVELAAKSAIMASFLFMELIFILRL